MKIAVSVVILPILYVWYRATLLNAGVLLLNAVLTVRAHCPNSHKDQGWEVFTDAVIAWLNENTSGTVFMLWGSYAHKKGARINKVSKQWFFHWGYLTAFWAVFRIKKYFFLIRCLISNYA